MINFILESFTHGQFKEIQGDWNAALISDRQSVRARITSSDGVGQTRKSRNKKYLSNL